MILYITYDGLLDQLGSSQILPYLMGLADAGYKIHILSVEKPQRTNEEIHACREELESNDIAWSFINFEESTLGKLRNRNQLFNAAKRVIDSGDFTFVHARSYVAAEIALKLKQRYSIPYVFDIRGFWIDERIERGLWDLSSPIRRLGVSYYRFRERSLYRHASQVITLTHKSVSIIHERFKVPESVITVIPCAADLSKFYPIEDSKENIRASLSLPADGLYVSYLGSLGGVYLVEELLILFRGILDKQPNAYLLLLSAQSALVLEALEAFNIPRERVLDRFVPHSKVNTYVNASNVNVFFLKDSFSINASMPTKVGEVWAAGIPIIANNIADLNQYFEQGENGFLTSDLLPETIRNVSDQFLTNNFDPPEKIRQTADKYFSLSKACNSYSSVYKEMFDSRLDRLSSSIKTKEPK